MGDAFFIARLRQITFLRYALFDGRLSKYIHDSE